MSITFISFKNETFDRLGSFAVDMPKYLNDITVLKNNFTIDNVLELMRRIDRDTEFKKWNYRNIYNRYFDEIEDMIYESNLT